MHLHLDTYSTYKTVQLDVCHFKQFVYSLVIKKIHLSAYISYWLLFSSHITVLTASLFGAKRGFTVGNGHLNPHSTKHTNIIE